MKELNGKKYIGFFRGMLYSLSDDNNDTMSEFDEYLNYKNELSKQEIIIYLNNADIGYSPMYTYDIITGKQLDNAGLIFDDEYVLPLDFIYYLEKYNIGVPIEYEEHIKNKISNE